MTEVTLVWAAVPAAREGQLGTDARVSSVALPEWRRRRLEGDSIVPTRGARSRCRLIHFSESDSGFRVHHHRPCRPVRKQAPTIHPLLGARVSSPLPQWQFSADLDLDRVPYLADHRKYGAIVFPATAFIETMRAAAVAASGGAACAIDDLVISNPLFVDTTDAAGVTLQTVVDVEAESPSGAGVQPSSRGRRPLAPACARQHRAASRRRSAADGPRRDQSSCRRRSAERCVLRAAPRGWPPLRSGVPGRRPLVADRRRGDCRNQPAGCRHHANRRSVRASSGRARCHAAGSRGCTACCGARYGPRRHIPADQLRANHRDAAAARPASSRTCSCATTPERAAMRSSATLPSTTFPAPLSQRFRRCRFVALLARRWRRQFEAPNLKACMKSSGARFRRRKARLRSRRVAPG